MLTPNQKITISVEFPALSDLVAYLQGNQQRQIDELTLAIASLSRGLKKSGDGLNEVVVDESK